MLRSVPRFGSVGVRVSKPAASVVAQSTPPLSPHNSHIIQAHTSRSAKNLQLLGNGLNPKRFSRNLSLKPIVTLESQPKRENTGAENLGIDYDREYWRKIPAWKDVTEEEFLNYGWTVSSFLHKLPPFFFSLSLITLHTDLLAF